jgi:hypothetical protein
VPTLSFDGVNVGFGRGFFAIGATMHQEPPHFQRVAFFANRHAAGIGAPIGLPARACGAPELPDNVTKLY